MCGINGIFAYHPAATVPAEAELLRTRDAMRARGPDGAGAWRSACRRCGLGNRRLSILDLSHRAAQPMRSEDGRTVVTYNGEIYNCRELRAELEAGGARFRTIGDTEVLLHLYAREGAAMVRRLRGMFAFAIWDDERQELLLARDPYGVKPLYTANDGWTFRFASQVKALLAGGALSREGSPAGIVGFHLFGSVPEPFTLYRDVRALPAGHTQVIDAAGPQEPQPFADLAGILSKAAAAPIVAAEAHERLRAALRDSVRAHLIADVEIGIFLSSGVDSTALLGLVHEAGRTGMRALTLAFDEFEGTADDEVPLARRTAQRYGVPHTVRRVDEGEFRQDLPAILEAMDQPSIDGVNTWFIAKAANEVGLKVALSGLGGDELLAGYRTFEDIPNWRRRCGPLAAIPGLGRLARLLVQAVAPGFADRQPKLAGLLEYAHRWGGAYLLRRGLFMPYELPDVMDPELAREGLRELGPLDRLDACLIPDPGSDIGRVCALESMNYLRNQLLRDADWAGMASSVEIRVPFVDVPLLEAAAPLLPTLKPGAGKAALLAAPSLPPPPEIKLRDKTGFVVPMAAWVERAAGTNGPGVGQSPEPQGLVSRRWSVRVLRSFETQKPTLSVRPDIPHVLIFRIGSIGDTVVALPCFHRVARAFPGARRTLITNIPNSQKAASVEAVLGESGLIDDVIYFAEKPRGVGELLTLRGCIRRTAATTLVYIADRDYWPTLRDLLYLRLCGMRQIFGMPLSADLRRVRIDPESGDSEREAERLVRCLATLGPIDLADGANWDLHLLPDEHRAAEAALGAMAAQDFIAVNLGGKSASKDWGDANWRSLLRLLASDRGDLALVFIGAADEFARSAAIAAEWPGETANLCGRLSPRESAAAMQRALLYLGHDSGPMHLAAAVGLPCVAVFGNYNLPKRWHPVGSGHRIIHQMRDIRAISADELHDAASAAIVERLAARSTPAVYVAAAAAIGAA